MCYTFFTITYKPSTSFLDLLYMVLIIRHMVARVYKYTKYMSILS